MTSQCMAKLTMPLQLILLIVLQNSTLQRRLSQKNAHACSFGFFAHVSLLPVYLPHWPCCADHLRH